MTETPSDTAAATRPTTLYRDPDDRMFAGVASAVARYTDTDPVIWRIVTVVLTVFGGTGIVLYLLGWLLIPKLGADRSVAEAWLRGRNRNWSAKSVVLAAIIIAVVVGGFNDSRGLAAAAVVGGVVYLVYRERQGNPLVPAFAPAGPPAAAAQRPVVGSGTVEPAGFDGGGFYGPQPWVAPPPPVRPPRPRSRSRLGLVTLSLAALTAGILSWISAAGADGLTPARIIAITLLVIGGGLVAGTWFGRARWLFAIGLLLCGALGIAIAANSTGATLHGGVGSRTWVADEAQPHQAYRLGIGEATLDLTGLPTTGRHLVVTGRVGLGHLIVVVPDGVPVRVHAKLKIGDITEFGHSLVNGDNSVERTLSYGPAGDPQVEVEALVGTGQVEVRHG